MCYDADFTPFGGERPVTDSCTQNNHKFEGKERDTETGNDDFGARYYSNRFGRWLSADWSNVPVPVPYANLSNPQTLNLYSMVAADPESFADLDGHEDHGVPTANTSATDCSGTGPCTPGNNVKGTQQPAQNQNQQDQGQNQNQTTQQNQQPQQPTTPAIIPGKLPPGADPKAVRMKYETKPVKPSPPSEPTPEPNPRPAPISVNLRMHEAASAARGFGQPRHDSRPIPNGGG